MLTVSSLTKMNYINEEKNKSSYFANNKQKIAEIILTNSCMAHKRKNMKVEEIVLVLESNSLGYDFLLMSAGTQC